jgi:hypothetical protein
MIVQNHRILDAGALTAGAVLTQPPMVGTSRCDVPTRVPAPKAFGAGWAKRLAKRVRLVNSFPRLMRRSATGLRSAPVQLLLAFRFSNFAFLSDGIESDE